MARKVSVEIVGDSRQLERAFDRSAKSASKFNREISRAGRGAAAGSGLFRGLGRSIAFASGGFIAFASLSNFLRESVDAAREAAVAQRSLAAQMKASGESFAANQQRIEEVAKSYARFGFQNDQVIESLTVLERGTGSINKAIELQGLTADIARAKNIDLAAAANTVAKVFGGQETALRRAVPGLRKTAHGYELIRQAQQKLAGQAAANTTASERFQATLHDTQEVIGTALLPILNKYLDALSRWLDEMQRSGQLAKDAKEFADAISAVAGAIGVLNVAVSKTKDLRDKLRDIPGFGAVFASGTEFLRGFTKAYHDMTGAWKRLLGIQDKAKAQIMYATPLGPPDPRATGAAAVGAAAAPPPRIKYTPKQLNQFFDAAIGRALSRAQYGSLNQQLATYRQIAEKIRQRIAVTRDITRKLKLEDELLSVIAQIKDTRAQLVERAIQGLQLGVDRAGLTTGLSDDLAALQKLNEFLTRRIKVDKNNLDLQSQQIAVQGQINDLRKQQAEQRKEAAREAADRRREALSTRLFGILGFGPGGAAKIPNLRQLRRQLAAMKDELATAPSRLQRQAAAIQKVLREAFVPPDVRAKLREMLNGIRNELKKGVGGGTPRGFTYGLPGVGGRSIAFAGAGVHVGTVNVYNTHNIGDLERQLTKRQAGRAHNRRGAR